MITTSLKINTIKPDEKYSICTLVTNLVGKEDNEGKYYYLAKKPLIRKFQQSFQVRFIKTTRTKLYVFSKDLIPILNQRVFRDWVFFSLKVKHLAHD